MNVKSNVISNSASNSPCNGLKEPLEIREKNLQGVYSRKDRGEIALFAIFAL